MFKDTMQEILDQLEAIGNYFTLDYINDKSDNQMASITVNGDISIDDLEDVVKMFENYPEFAPTSTIKDGEKIVYYFKENRDSELDESKIKSLLSEDKLKSFLKEKQKEINQLEDVNIESINSELYIVGPFKKWNKIAQQEILKEFKVKIKTQEPEFYESLLSPSEFKTLKINESLNNLFGGPDGPVAGYIRHAEEMEGPKTDYYILSRFFKFALPGIEEKIAANDPFVLSACSDLVEALKKAK